MVDTWWVATLVAVVAGAVGFFTVLRGSTFVAHALPQTAFAGAAGAALLGADPLLGIGTFAVASALGVGWLSRRGRSDVATALVLVLMLGLGGLFLALSAQYSSQVYSLLFGEVLGVSTTQLGPTAGLTAGSLVALALLGRPLLLEAVLGAAADPRGRHRRWLEGAFLVLVAVATTMSVPVVGALLMFSLMVGPPAAARHLTDRPWRALLLSMGLALATVWASVAAAYLSNWPVGFYVGVLGAGVYGTGRLWAARRRRRRGAHLAG